MFSGLKHSDEISFNFLLVFPSFGGDRGRGKGRTGGWNWERFMCFPSFCHQHRGCFSVRSFSAAVQMRNWKMCAGGLYSIYTRYHASVPLSIQNQMPSKFTLSLSRSLVLGQRSPYTTFSRYHQIAPLVIYFFPCALSPFLSAAWNVRSLDRLNENEKTIYALHTDASINTHTHIAWKN